ncbi:uncharacterized protein J7T54_005192 [Emericellopsis cladophorae]|uniref:Uncharacterized protein n=1 Tax=Emericellopsis cladophorae TaxID=2686198 RepID=A0A9P9XXB1_9HYPO|nr:uncharacterized protein J7T54_005192 [Emericellopsis cladophorae]KAI6779378.1 hypothetical protein J7T54_005192 [Emericellopsis cladophorae]
MAHQTHECRRFATDDSASSLGKGLVEISAVATLIGAPIAETLTLGIRSAGCLPWASMSSFGLLHVAKAALAGAIPHWLREAMGLQNGNVLAAVGSSVLLDARESSKKRQAESNVVKMITITGFTNQRAGDSDDMESKQSRGESVSAVRTLMRRLSATDKAPAPIARCIHHVDKSTGTGLDSIRAAAQGEEIPIHQFVPDFAGQRGRIADAIVLGLSLVKIAETVVLKTLGSESLHWFSTVIPVTKFPPSLSTPFVDTCPRLSTLEETARS